MESNSLSFYGEKCSSYTAEVFAPAMFHSLVKLSVIVILYPVMLLMNLISWLMFHQLLHNFYSSFSCSCNNFI